MSLGEFYQGFFHITWLLWTIVWLVLARNVKRTVQRESALPRLLDVALLICAAVLLGTPHVPVSGLSVSVLPDSEWRIWAGLGAVLTLVGLLFTVWARIYLGRNWSGVAAIKADHELVVGGPYQWVRHPIYSGLALAFLGTAIAIGQWRGMLAVELALIAFGHRIVVEERFMRQQFGAVYDTYAQRVRALVPGLIRVLRAGNLAVEGEQEARSRLLWLVPIDVKQHASSSVGERHL